MRRCLQAFVYAGQTVDPVQAGGKKPMKMRKNCNELINTKSGGTLN
jgi:hypothetical protein